MKKVNTIEEAKKELIAVAKQILPAGLFCIPGTYDWFEFKVSLIDGNFEPVEQIELIREWCDYINERKPENIPALEFEFPEEPDSDDDLEWDDEDWDDDEFDNEENFEPEHPDENGVMKFYSQFGGYDVTMEKQKYYNGNLRIQLWCEDGPYATLTTNFDKKLPDGMAYVDVNNVPTAEDFIRRYKLGEPQGQFKMSGFCCYPLYKFF